MDGLQKPTQTRKLIAATLLLIVAGAVTLAYVKQQEHQAKERLNAALVLSNRHIGMTPEELTQLAEQMGDKPIGLTQAREAIFWIVCSGRFSRSDVPEKLPEIQLLIEHGASPKDAVLGTILGTDHADQDPFARCPQ